MKKVRMVIATVCLVILVLPSLFADEGLGQHLSGGLHSTSPSVRALVLAETEETAADRADEWDVIVLKNGKRIEGWIVKEDDDKTILERRSAGGNRFYTAGISKTEIARILRLAPEVRKSLREQRRAQETIKRPVEGRAASPQRPIAGRSNAEAARAAAVPAGVVRGAMYGGTPYSGGYGAAGGYGGGAYGAGAGGYGAGAGGYGAGGFGGGAYGGGGYGGGGGFGGGGYGGGGLVFSNILQLCQPVNHALVGEVEPVIGLSGQTSSAARTTVAGR